VVADFADGADLKLYDKILDEVKYLDIAIVVNNAGLNTRGYFKDESLEDLYEMTVVNTYPYCMLTHKFLPLLQQRKKKSALITVSSGITFSAAPYDGTYAATKIFEYFMMHSIKYE
jgi:short-subunit dehydrogenase